MYKNSGRYRIPVLDERFYFKDFDYVVNRNFESLPDATSAEVNLLTKLANVTDIDAFLTDLTKITIENENSITGLNVKIQRLEEIIEIKQQEVQSYVDAQIENEAFIDSIAFDNLKKDDEIIQKDESINQLNETITTTLSELESNVANQINNINTAQDAEITALKSQIAALQSTITSLRASKPPVSSRGTGTITTTPVPTFGGPNPANAGPPSLSGT